MGRHATGVAREDGEQVVFFRRQLDRRPVSGDETLVKIHDRAFDLHPAGRLGRLGRLPGASAMETRSRLTLSPPPSIRDMSSRLATNRKGRPVSSSIDDKSSIRSAGSSCRQAGAARVAASSCRGQGCAQIVGERSPAARLAPSRFPRAAIARRGGLALDGARGQVAAEPKRSIARALQGRDRLRSTTNIIYWMCISPPPARHIRRCEHPERCASRVECA